MMEKKVDINVRQLLIDRLEKNINLIIDSNDTHTISALCGSAFENIILAAQLNFISEENMDELADQICEIADKRIKELN